MYVRLEFEYILKLNIRIIKCYFIGVDKLYNFFIVYYIYLWDVVNNIICFNKL